VSRGDVDEQLALGRWWSGLADVLLDAGRRIGQLAEQVGRDWPDALGQEWAERVTGARTDLCREAGTAAELGAEYARRGLDAEPPAVGARRPGMRLGGTEADRVGEERGMRIAELPEPPRPG
jgi:hypothetical protein